MEKIIDLYKEISEKPLAPGLYVVATDIGNPADITIRALAILSQVELIICEEIKTAYRFMRRYGLDKPLVALNEHDEKEKSKELMESLIENKIPVALISEAGTPLFADPGNYIVRQCHYFNIPVIPVPGPSCLMTALMMAGVKSEGFIYYGFLPASRPERIAALKKLKYKSESDIIFLEAPYRLPFMLKDMCMILDKQRKGCILYKLTYPEEKMFTGTIEELLYMTTDLPKGEFVVILRAERKYKYNNAPEQ